MRRFVATIVKLCGLLSVITTLGAAAVADEPWVAAPVVANSDSLPLAPSPIRYWLVRTHGLGDPGATVAELQQLDVQQLAGEQWRLASADQLVDSARQRATVIYIHGNRGSDQEAISHGTRIGDFLSARVDCPALQIVIWSWPSAQMRRGRRDFYDKAERADTEAWYLCSLLSRFPVESRVGLVGYSYGARVVTGAMHWTAGGIFEGRSLLDSTATTDASLPNPAGERAASRYRVALLAPALHHDWLAPHGCHGEAWRSTEQLLLLYNTCDPALRWYKFVYRCEKPEALGRWGLPTNWIGAESERFEQWDVASVIGKTHDEDAYLYTPWISDRISDVLLGAPAAD